MQTIVYAVYAKLNSILDFTDYINQIELLTKKRWLKYKHKSSSYF